MKRFLGVVILLCVLALGGCRAQKNALPSAQQFLIQEKCVQCHQFPMPGIGKKYGNDWHDAHFWDPQLVVKGSTMPNYSSEFLKVEAIVSNKSYVTPSGESVLAFAPNPFLKERFTFDPNRFSYFFVSNAQWKNLPGGLKAFFRDEVSGKKQDSIPVVWVPRRLKETVRPGSRVTLLVPGERLKKTIQLLQEANPPAPETEWLNIPVPSPGKANLSKGKRIYESQCATCHGTTGDGNGPASVFLFPKPRDFRSGEYKFKTTLTDEPPSDADLFRTISSGMRMTAMPAWNSLQAEDRWNVIAYIKRFAVDPKTKKNMFEENPAKNILEATEPGVGTSKEATLGQALFFGKGKCNDCHGPGAGSKDKLPHGDGPSAPVLVDDWGYPISPSDLAGGTLKRGNSPREIYVTLTTGFMGTPMPTYKDTLTDKERWGLAFYVSRLNKGEFHEVHPIR